MKFLQSMQCDVSVKRLFQYIYYLKQSVNNITEEVGFAYLSSSPNKRSLKYSFLINQYSTHNVTL